MPDPNEVQAARDARLAGLHDQLVSAVDALVSSDDWRQAMEFAARFRSRSFNNTLLIWVQHLAAFGHDALHQRVLVGVVQVGIGQAGHRHLLVVGRWPG